MVDAGNGLAVGADGRCRCAWGDDDGIYARYHDTEWGRPVGNDRRLFEKVCLEGFQSGLSWLTILRKRDHFREAFHDFDFERVARMGETDIERLLTNRSIIRHRGKIEATINNAARAIELRAEAGSLAAHFWAFEPNDRPERVTWDWVRANPTTDASWALSQSLKQRGWRFVGPTTMYALMQAMGIVNDHVEGCHVRDEVERERQAFARP